ncbi:MAG: hypothetical protein GX663_10610 [Clostridiales bacterium]|nr:hypothetical protein [Clostridiales bacterium]
MKFEKEKLPLNNNLYNKLNNICNFSNIRLEVVNGLIFKAKDMNISFIEPHRFVIVVNDIKLVLLCYDNLNLYLYEKDKPINIPILKEIIDGIKGGIYNG